MSQIEKFNYELNKRSYLDNQQINEYRKSIELLLKSSFSKLQNRGKIVVIGAGNMNEVCVEFLLRFFNRVILTDIDTQSINEMLRYKRLTQQKKQQIEVKKIEYTGFEQIEFFDDFKERLVNCHTKEKIKQVIDSKLEGLETYQFLKYEKDIDFILVTPIYTQLIYHQVLSECKILEMNGYPDHLINYIKEYMLEHMVDVIDRFNANLVKNLAKGGLLFVLSDILQVENNSDLYRRVVHSVKNYSVMEEVYESYKQKYGMGLGDYGLYNLDDLLPSTLSRWLIWPYDENSSFIVKLKIYTK